MKILVSGAGIAGPCLAYWLLKEGKGKHEIVMIEKADELRYGGYMIDLWGIGYDIASRMGLEESMRSNGYKASDLKLVNDNGEEESSFPLHILDELLDGKYISIQRSELARLIYESLPLNSSQDYPFFSAEDKSRINVRFGTEISDIAETDGEERMLVVFNDGSVDSFDLIVGADGLHSNTRRIAFHDVISRKNPLKNLGMTVAAVELEGEFEDEIGEAKVYSVPGRTLITFSLTKTRYLAFLIVREKIDVEDIATPNQRKMWVKERFQDLKWRCPMILEKIEDLEDIYVDIVAQTRLESWTKSGVVLIGDAAASPSLLAGEGVGLGMTEAYVLAHKLNTSSGQLDEALEEYEKDVKPFVSNKQDAVQGVKFLFAPGNTIQLWWRNLLSKFLSIDFVVRLAFKPYITTDYELPEY